MELTITEASKVKNVSRQAIYLAIKEGRLKVIKRGKLQKVTLASLVEMDKTRYVRAAKVFQGEDLYSDKKGIISPPKASRLTGLSKQAIYNGIYSGKLKAIRKGRAWVILVKDLISFQTFYLNRNKSDMTLEDVKKAFQMN